MKRLILVGGPMGVGKTAACRELQSLLPANVFLDGDWCWNMRPFAVTEETRRMVLENIHFLLNQFLRCGAFQNIIFGWVMHRREIIDAVLSGLETRDVKVNIFTLMSDPRTLSNRVKGDMEKGIRSGDALERSLLYLKCCQELDTIQIDTSVLSPEGVARAILQRFY